MQQFFRLRKKAVLPSEHEQLDRIQQLLSSNRRPVFESGTTDNVYHFVLRHATFLESAEKQVITLLKAIEAKDPYTRGHSEAVACYSTFLAQQVGLTHDEIEHLQIAAYLHDIGKVMIDRRILIKPGNLNHTEMLIIRKHPEIGYRILKSFSMPGSILDAVKHHHERFDGTGYPDKLFKYEIPIEARILAIADAFDAMTTCRPYREKRAVKHALDELLREQGRQFDSELVEVFIRKIIRTIK